MNDIKKKFIDILFDSDPDIDDESREIEQTPTNNTELEKKSVPSIKAKDILYRKSSNSPFINYGDSDISVKTLVEDDEENDEYVLSPQLSPMFGILNKGEIVKQDSEESSDTIVKKPEDYHLDIVTSPIYGYGKKEDVLENYYKTYGKNEEFNEDQELNSVFFDSDNNSSDTQEISLFDTIEDDKKEF